MKIGNGNTDSRIYTAAADLRRRGPKFSAAAARPVRRSALIQTTGSHMPFTVFCHFFSFIYTGQQHLYQERMSIIIPEISYTIT